METLQKLTEELSKLGPEGSTALLQSKMQNISDSFNAFKETFTDKYVTALSKKTHTMPQIMCPIIYFFIVLLALIYVCVMYLIG